MTTRAVDADGNFPKRRRFALSTTANLAPPKSSESERCGSCVAIALSEKPGVSLPPPAGNQQPTQPTEKPCESKVPQTVRSTSNQCSHEVQSGGNGQVASIQVQTPDLRGGCAWKTVRCPSQKSTCCKSFQDTACTSGPGKRAGLSPCPRSFNRTNCSGPLLPGRSIACWVPANLTSSHPNPRNRATTAATACWNTNDTLGMSEAS